MMRFWLAIAAVPVLAAWAADLPPSPYTSTVALRHDTTTEFRVEKHTVPGGAELLTVFGQIPEAGPSKSSNPESVFGDVPLLSVLRDTLGDNDPGNDRLRYVWVLTASRPTLLQRMAAATPFYYWRAGIGKHSEAVPSPVLDLSAARKPVWSAMAGTAAQLLAFDPNGAIIRSSTRSYRNNWRDHRQLHLLEGLGVLSQLEDAPEVNEHFTKPELLALQARLALASQTLGGFVSDTKLSDAYMNQRTRTMEERGHNWELLRQRAEANGLYFQPFGLNGVSTQALLWVPKEDLAKPHAFDSKFLNIRDPFSDTRLKNWTGYTEVKPVEPGQPEVEMIPLALYSLDHPKVPLLLVDFRNTTAPKRREMIRHALVDGIAGIVGYSRWGNWPYFVATSAGNFVLTRHGVPNDRAARIKGYSQVRQWIAMDPALDPALRLVLQKRLEQLGVNPLEDDVVSETKFARHQYEALQKYADLDTGLRKRLEYDRDKEAVALDHGTAAQVGLQIAHYSTLGIYTHREQNSIALQLRVDEARRGRSSRKAITMSSYEDR
jgi:hypothetical protein